ncbi:hypothetical protein ACLOJK_018720 [Asimina triloba]
MGVIAGLLDEKCWGCRILIELSSEVSDLEGQVAAFVATSRSKMRHCRRWWRSGGQWTWTLPMGLTMAAMAGSSMLATADGEDEVVPSASAAAIGLGDGEDGSDQSSEASPVVTSPTASSGRWVLGFSAMDAEKHEEDDGIRFSVSLLCFLIGSDQSIGHPPEVASPAAMAASLEDYGAESGTRVVH